VFKRQKLAAFVQPFCVAVESGGRKKDTRSVAQGHVFWTLDIHDSKMNVATSTAVFDSIRLRDESSVLSIFPPTGHNSAFRRGKSTAWYSTIKNCRRYFAIENTVQDELVDRKDLGFNKRLHG
jgi:hypothetical protein